MTRSVRIFLVAWVLIIGWLAWGVVFPDPDRKPVAVSELRRELESLPTFPRAIPMGDVSVVWKWSISTATRPYRTDKSIEQVLNYYNAALPEKGWTHAGQKESGARSWTSFCKGPISLTVGGIRRLDGDAVFSVAVRWARSRRGSSYCE